MRERESKNARANQSALRRVEENSLNHLNHGRHILALGMGSCKGSRFGRATPPQLGRTALERAWKDGTRAARPRCVRVIPESLQRACAHRCLRT
eukprot:6200276-Pleurochrysis_carterae.AAC.3